MFKDFPSLHPLVIHFPVVLILISVAFQAVATWKPDWTQIRWATLLIMTGGFLSSLLTSTLFHAMITPNAPKLALETFANHEEYAQYTLWTSGIVLLLKVIGIFYVTNRRSFEVLIFAGAIISAIFLSITGHHGAKLTHIYGVGPQGKYLMEEHEHGGSNGMTDNMKEGNLDSMSSMKNHNENTSHPDSDSTMPEMGNMPNMKLKQNIKNGDQKLDMKGMDMRKDKQDMKGMDMGKDKGNMKGMNMGKDKEDMKGMDMKKDNQDMKGMNMGKDKQDMKGMDMKKDMGSMKMPTKNGMDTITFPDNNPLKKKKPNIQ